MSTDLLKFAFVAGELSPRLFGRTDLEKYDLALAKCKNWFVDYRGGISTRAGTEFLDYIWQDDKPIRLCDFKFAADIPNTSVIIMGDHYVRFGQDGAYILEDFKPVTGVAVGSPTTITVVGHGYVDGDWVKLDGMGPLSGGTFVIDSTGADTFTLSDVDGNVIDTTGMTIPNGQVGRIYTLTSPYAAEDLAMIHCHQVRDVIRLTHHLYPVYNLERFGAANWTLAAEDFAIGMERPTNLNAVVENAGAFSTAFVVTAVNDIEEESLPSSMLFVTNTVDYSATAGSVRVTWKSVDGARYYKVYRTRIVAGEGVSAAFEVGYIGRTHGTYFVDNNYVPDFARNPPNEYDPFANGAIRQVNIQNAGSGYSNASVITVTDPTGSGFLGRVAVATSKASATGPIAGIIVLRGGSGYTAPVFNVTVGTGAVLTAELSELEGNYPSISAIFQQRQLYAATDNEPLTIFGSKPGMPANFSFSDIVLDNDSYQHTIDSEDMSPLRHLEPSRGGLLVFNHSGIWQLTGEGGIVTPTNATAEPQMFKGSTLLMPLKVDRDLVYAEGKGGTIRLLSYNEIARVYAGNDLSILANHLINPNAQLTQWVYADQPFKVVWGVRQDGCLLGLTLLKEQDVWAWSQHWTRGLFYDVATVQEGTVDTVYLVVERFVKGKRRKYWEKFADRTFENVEDAWSVDCGLALGSTLGVGTLTVASPEGDEVLATSSEAAFDADSVGSVIRGGGGLMEVIEYMDPLNVQVRIDRPITALLPETDIPLDMDVWTLDKPVTAVGGLEHLEGQVVSILADGNVVPLQQVINGAITLPQPATRVVVGLGFECVAQTLPPPSSQSTVLEGHRKRIVGLALRLHESRGLLFGSSGTTMYEVKERVDEKWGAPTEPLTGVKYVGLEPYWNEEAQVSFQQVDPLPVTILGYVADAEVGDDND